MSLMPWTRTTDWVAIIKIVEDTPQIDELASAHAETALFLVEHFDRLSEADRAALRRFASFADEAKMRPR
ncbi:MAG: hypothetical protein JJU33_00430 [Phycisphaerales bacterium]|nr:hypothetical protein [Phycisphaerales bacterium]